MYTFVHKPMFRRVSILLFVLIPCGGFLLKAQLPDTVKMNSKNGIVIFDNTKDETLQVPPVSKSNLIKIAPLQFARGDFGLQYERKLTRWLSANVGFGLTHRDYIFERISEDQKYLSPYFKGSVGYSARLGLRFYIHRDYWPSGWYTTPEVAYRKYNLTANLKRSNADGQLEDQALGIGYSFMECRAYGGYVWTDLLPGLSIDVFGGLMFQFIQNSYPVMISGLSGNYFEPVFYQKFAPNVTFGFNIGYVFGK